MESFIHTGLDIILGIGIIYLIFFREYIKKKGSNLADKQDIANITQQIEQVKKEFTRENEFLKANLQLIISNQVQQSNEERNAIINFHDYYSKWLNHGLLDIQFNQYNRTNINDMILKRKKLDEYYYQTNVAQYRIMLLCDNSDINIFSNELVVETLKFNHWAVRMFLKLMHNLERDKINADQFLSLIKTKPVTQEAYILANKEKEIQLERDKIFNEFYDEMISEYKKILPFQNQFVSAVRAHLNKSRQL